ncbi:hypothetical protein Aduo_010605 [Ancylostoma duodenale]
MTLVSRAAHSSSRLPLQRQKGTTHFVRRNRMRISFQTNYILSSRMTSVRQLRGGVFYNTIRTSPNTLPRLSITHSNAKDTRMDEIFGKFLPGKSDPGEAESILTCSSNDGDAIQRQKCSVVAEETESSVSSSSRVTTTQSTCAPQRCVMESHGVSLQRLTLLSYDLFSLLLRY